jgi:hypothetical protein
MRVHVPDYRMALLDFIETEGRDVIELFGAQELLRDLRARITGGMCDGRGGQLRFGAAIIGGIERAVPAQIDTGEFVGQLGVRHLQRRHGLMQAHNHDHAELSDAY